MKVCYVDEAGCTGAMPSATSNIQPALIVAGIIVDYSKIHKLTKDIIDLKQRFFSKLLPTTSTYLDWIQAEVKGSELRRQVDSSSRSERRHAIGVLNEIVRLATAAEIKIVGRVWIKKVSAPIKSTSIYTSSIQSIYTDFQRFLTDNNDFGFVVLDSRLKHLNTQVAHSIFTQKFKGTGDSYDRIIELPAFSHSDNHAGLQLADLICSAYVYPMALETYCKGHIHNVHMRARYIDIKNNYKLWLKGSQFRYTEASGKSRGGLIVSDGVEGRPGGELFR